MESGDIVRALALWPVERRGRPDPRAALRVAAFISPGLTSLGRCAGFPVAVIAATPDPVKHLARIARDQHGCWSLREDWLSDNFEGQELDPLPPRFEQLRFDDRWLGGRRLPAGVVVEAGSILVALPRDLHARFIAKLKVRLAPRRFEVVAARPGRVMRRRSLGLPPTMSPRYACAPRVGGGLSAFTPVDDLYCFRPKDLPALAEAIVACRDQVTMLDHMMRVVRG